ncbi:4-hydroxy-tetrahydrodipicolinate synthase [Negadavirga shengliensis]|uniref:4-hydroxy-tetrahydrodipicolinate synthase n=1 Tax=Negadavirga shengliensis TaxID=1389218 RepID=A0ABV9T8L8_9BACT
MKKFKGAGVALVTPFQESGSVDYPALERVIEHVIQGGVNYLVVQGTTGETAVLTKEEKKEVLAFVKKTNKGRLPIVFGIGGNNTQEVIDTIHQTDFTGVEGILSVSPYYNKPSQGGIIAHYEAIADVCPVPVILYNVPGRTMSNMLAETTLELAKHPNIIGMKEASGNLEQCMQIAHRKPDDFLLISGDDLMTTAMRAIGAEGVISVIANAYPRIMASIINGTDTESRNSTFSLLEINPLMYEESNPVGVKFLMSYMGLCREQVRLPLMNASASLKNRIIAAAEKIPSQLYSAHMG